MFQVSPAPPLTHCKVSLNWGRHGRNESLGTSESTIDAPKTFLVPSGKKVPLPLFGFRAASLRNVLVSVFIFYPVKDQIDCPLTIYLESDNHFLPRRISAHWPVRYAGPPTPLLCGGPLVPRGSSPIAAHWCLASESLHSQKKPFLPRNVCVCS